MATFREVPVLEVNTENFRQIWPTLVQAIKSATFVAMDAELSGLGNRKQLFAKDMDIRYAGMCDAAQTRSIISLGLSCFQIQPVTQPQDGQGQGRGGKSVSFMVQTFNVLVLCSENYTVEPLSLKFLIDHGFDFNKQYAKGLPYYRGADKDTDKDHQSLRHLFTEIVSCGVPVILHNAPVDLVFLYHSFYANLPANIATFLADTSEVLRGGVYDTKYIAEYKARFSASYLEYVFRKCQRQNHRNHEEGLSHIKLLFPPYPRDVPHIAWLSCGLDDSPADSQDGKKGPCRDFASHGWCTKTNKCPYSHDIDTILDKEDRVRAQKRPKRRRPKKDAPESMDAPECTDASESTEAPESSGDADMDVDAGAQDRSSESVDKDDITKEKNDLDTTEDIESDQSNLTDTKSPTRIVGHRAGYDAFMTGVAFAQFVSRYGKYGDITANQKLYELGMQEFVNKVALSGKDIPLSIVKSAFAKTSKEHKEKIQRIRTPTRKDMVE